MAMLVVGCASHADEIEKLEGDLQAYMMEAAADRANTANRIDGL